MSDHVLEQFLDVPEAQNGDAPTDAKWIVIPKWDEFQHYRNRSPVWIKVYTRLLHDPAFHELTFHERGVLLSLWMEYAASDREIRDRPPTGTRQTRDRHATVSKLLGQRVTRATLESLNRAGFIEFSAIKPIAQPTKTASTEGETEREVEKKPPKTPFRRKPKKRKTVCPDCEVGGGQHTEDCPQVKPPGEQTELVPAEKSDDFLAGLTSEGGHE